MVVTVYSSSGGTQDGGIYDDGSDSIHCTASSLGVGEVRYDQKRDCRMNIEGESKLVRDLDQRVGL